MNHHDNIAFETDHGAYGTVKWYVDSDYPQLTWGSLEYWHVADDTGDERSHVARLDVDLGVRFDDDSAPIVIKLDFVEEPMHDWDVTVHLCISIRSDEEWTRFKSDHLDPLFVRAEELAENLCESWSGEETDDSEEEERAI